MAEMAQLLRRTTNKGKASMTTTEEDNEGHPPGFTPPHVQTQPEAYPRGPSVIIKPQQGQVNAGIPMNFQTGLGFNLGDNPVNPVVIDLDVAEREEMRLKSSRQLEERCRWLEEKFKALENADNHQGIDAKDLSLVSDLDSLVGAAAMWYNQLSRARIGSWRDLAQAFMQQYNLAPFITHMIGGTTKSFADVVMAGEMIENAIRGGKIEGKATKRLASRRKDNEVNNKSSYNSKAVTVSQPRVTTVEQQDYQKQGSGLRQNSENVLFMPIPVTYNPHIPNGMMQTPKCEYHAGISGHSIENCIGFKKEVERLIKMGVVKFDDTPSTENPLPNHSDQGVNTVGDTDMRRIKEGVSEVRTLMKMIWEEMVKREMIISKEMNKGVRDYCEFYAEEGHEIQECDEFKTLVQSLMDNKEIEFYEASSNEGHICTLEGAPKNQNRPRIIISLPGSNEVETPMVPKVIIHKPVSFPYKDNKRVNPRIITAIGKHYDAKGVGVEPAKAKALDKGKRTETLVNEPVKEEEPREFLKFLKHSKYSVVEQLRKQPARISVLALLLSSEAHREALMKVLNETYVTNDISVNKLDRLVSNISADNFIYFNDDEIPLGGMGSAKALHITTHCKRYTLPMRAFDGTERKVIGRIDIPLMIRPNTYEVDFLVMDIKPSYNCLLGRPWIHSARVMPSSLHQKLKLVADGGLVTINAKEDIIATVTSSTPYVEANEEAIECSFRSLEFVNATFISEGNEVSVPKISRTTRMELKEKRDHFGLGFRPDQKQRRREMDKRQERRMACLSGKEVEWELMTFPHISQTFVSGGIIHPKGRLLEEGSYYINAVHNEGFEQGNLEGIRPYEPESSLNNWVAEELPVVFKDSLE
ncbi:uncharacterized protein [Gossypium hirsutum]|uniref:Gag-pro-like protein n=1 Tax=Gossypium hirsutum TaxID=3635 RepID=A0ABM3A9Q5_GOSHI|nr:uncharacterized protein LOC107941929 [Gossypium hirsutum]